MLEEFEIRKKWREICQRDRPKGCIIDSGAFAVELVRWVESGLTQRAVDGGEALPLHNHIYVDGYCACGHAVERHRH